MRFYALNKLSLRFAWMNLRGNPRFALLFALNLCLGLSALTLITGFQNAITRDSYQRSQIIASADLTLTARRIFSAEELQRAQQTLKDQVLEYSHRSRMYSMVSKVEGTEVREPKLSELHFVENTFPLYGEVTLASGKPLSSLWSQKKDSYPHLPLALSENGLITLGVEVGDQLQIGQEIFTISAVVAEDSALTGISNALAPRLYLSMDHREQTDLIQKGSSLWNDHHYKLKDPEKVDEVYEALKSTFDDDLSITVRSHRGSSQQSSRLLSLLTDYLSLVGLVAFFLSCLGAGFLFRSYLSQNFKETATLISLGLSAKKALIPAAYYMMLLSTLATLCALIVALTFSFLAPYLLAYLKLPALEDLQFYLKIWNVLELWLMSLLGTSLLTLPLFIKISRTQVPQLFSGSHLQNLTSPQTNPRTLTLSLAYLPALILMWFLAIRYSGSLRTGSVFILALWGATFILWLLSFAFQKLAQFISLPASSPLSWRLALLWLKRNPFYGRTSFMATSGSLLLITLIPLLQHSLRQEIERPRENAAEFFLLDIQPNQRSELEKILQEFNLLDHWQDAPFILAEINTINGEDFHLTQDKNSHDRSRQFRGGTRLTYRQNLSSSETITQGEFYQGSWQPENNQLPEISVTKEYARRRGMKLGDVLSFNIISLEVKGKITSLRDVDWLSFQPNFFMQFQPGVLEKFPQSYIGVLGGLPDEKTRHALQSRLVKELHNISIVDIRKVREVVSSTIKSISQAFILMAFLSVLSGFLIFAFMLHYSLRARLKNMALLSALGLEISKIKKTLTLEHAFWGLLASCSGAVISLGLCYTLTRLIFATIQSVSLSLIYPTAFILLGFVTTYTLAYLMAHFKLKKPLYPLLTKKS